MEVMREELSKARAEIDRPRMTDIIDALADQDDESLIEPGQMVVTITRDGFIKRTTLETFRAQNRGGRGRSGASTRGDDIVTRSFNAHTHQFVLFFSSGGKAFREKVWRLPEGGPIGKGRALVNLLPELGSDTITTVLPLPQDETLWDSLHLLFATASGSVRRNKLSDFRNVRATGLIAMKLEDGDRLIGVATCREGQDAFLATRKGRCIRFELSDDTVRVFAGRDSSGVRGIKLANGDEVIGLSVLEHVEVSIEERAAYLRLANAKRRNGNGNGNTDEDVEAAADGEEVVGDVTIDDARFDELAAKEEFLLTVTDAGFGKRSSAYEYRVTGRGGQGIANITLAPRNGTAVAATFPVREGDDVMLVTDAGRLIRVPADQVRITGRQAMGVTLFRVDADEHVTSVFPVVEEEPDEDAEENAPNG
jgi:DNA gyrase subunit A